MDVKPQFEKTKLILQGLALIYPDDIVISLFCDLFNDLKIYDKDQYHLQALSLVDLSENISHYMIHAELAKQTNVLTDSSDVLKLHHKIHGETLKKLKKMYYHLFTYNDDKFVFRLLGELTGTRLVNNIAAIRNKVCLPDLEDCFSKGQIKSKLWLVEELKKLKLNYSRIELLCGWYALSAYLLSESELKVNSYDLDETATRVANILNQDTPNFSKTFLASCQNIHDIDTYGEDALIINTSCEHLENFQKWYTNVPTNSLVALQSNNFFDCDQHVNCVASLEEFKETLNLSQVHYAGELELPSYTRFMVIGVK